MFDFFRKHTWLLKIVLGFVVLAFVGGGIYEGYGGFIRDDNATVAKVDGKKITRNEWDAAQRDQLERVRRQMPNVDAKLFDSPEMKRQSLDAVVREHVMLAAADELHLTISNERLQRELLGVPQFKKPDGQFDFETYKTFVESQGMSPAAFEARMRRDMASRQVAQTIVSTATSPVAATNAALDAMFQQREVQVQMFTTKDLLTQVTPTDAQIDAYYNDPTKASQFMSPEVAAIEYVVLDVETMKKSVAITQDDLRKYYDENAKRYTSTEERRASHILVKVDPSAPTVDRARAKTKAEGLLADVKSRPASFAEVARKYSDDPGSAEKGGDLDFFGRGGLAAQPLEDAAFALKADEISGVVTSDFGYHIVKLTSVRGGQKKPFEAVKGELENEIRMQLAQKRFSEAAIEFTNTVYEQPDSLKPVADKLNLELRSVQGLKRVPAIDASTALANPKFLEAVFSPEAVRNKRNTEAIEVAPSTLVSGRIVKYEAARKLPLVEIKPQVRERLVLAQAASLARKLGEARVAELRAAPATAMTQAVVVISRASTRELPAAVIDAALKAPSAALPSYIGVSVGDQGFAAVKIGRVLGRDPVTADTVRAQSQYAQAWGDAESQAYYAALKTRYKTEIKPDALRGVSVAAADSTATSETAEK